MEKKQNNLIKLNNPVNPIIMKNDIKKIVTFKLYFLNLINNLN